MRKRMALGIIGALGLVLGSAPTASAGLDGPDAWSNPSGSRSWFKAYGDHFWVMDSQKDGHSAVGRLVAPISRTKWNTKGYLESRDFNYDFKEGVRVKYYSCLGEWSSQDIFACGPSKEGWA